MRNQMTIEAKDKGAGMDMDEVTDSLKRAREAGFNMLIRTRCGWRGQIQWMVFEERKGPR